MTALSGPLHIAALVLVVSGVQKLLRPGPAVDAMRSAGLPAPPRPWPGWVLGAVEASVGLAVFAVPTGATSAALAATYLGLAAFVVVLRRRDASAGCGCFGRADTPPTVAHVVLDLSSAGVAALAAVAGAPDVADVVDSPALAIPYAAAVAVGTALVVMAPALLSDLSSARRTPRSFGRLP